MEKKLFKFLILFQLVILLFFVTCNQPSSSGGGGGGDDGPVSLPVQTIDFQNDGNGFIQFYTNDNQYLGYGFFNYYDDTNETPMVTPVEVQTKKISGVSNYGYGVIFCV